MACKSCAERRARMKAWLAERFRVEEIHRKAKQQAGRTGAEYQHKRWKLLRQQVNRENKHPDEPPLVMPGELPER